MNIGLIRYNNDTYEEVLNWKRRKSWKGCVYGVSKSISMKGDYNNGSFKLNSEVYIIEMNNEENKIMGIGKILYTSKINKRTHIHSGIRKIGNKKEEIKREDSNRFIYKSKYHRDRNYLMKKDKEVVEYLEDRLFKGSHHMKRGNGITRLYEERLFKIIPEKKRKIYKCGVCGLAKKGHVCPGKRVVGRDEKEKRCKYCYKALKTNGGLGHICDRYVEDRGMLEYITLFFMTLFN